MLPFSNTSIVRAIHEDRIRAAKRPVPEWVGIATPRKRRRPGGGMLQAMRSSFGRALRRLAATVDPQGSTATS